MHNQFSVSIIVSYLALFVVNTALSAPAGNVTQARVLAESAKGENWFLNGGNFHGEHFSPLAQINDSNVGELALSWSLDLPAPNGISATPIVVDGTIYLSTAQSIVFAIHAVSGKILWSYDPENTIDNRVNRGVAVWDGKVFVSVDDCRLIALHADTGREIWSKVTCNPEYGYGISDAPYVGGGKVFIGNNGSESREKNRGYVSAYDVNDGSLLWRFFTVPSDNPDENISLAMKMAAKSWSGDALQKFGGGGSAWNGMTYDPQLNLLFFGTAGALPYLQKDRNPEGGDNLFTSSVIAVNADSGEYVWHYQTVPHDSWEYNANMNIILADLDIHGKQREVLMIAPKNGFFYVLDRVTGELISAKNYVKVNWATHINLETGRPELDPAGMFWNQPIGVETAIWPNMWGAHSWHAMAYHSGHKLIYIPVIDVPEIVTMLDDGDFIDRIEVVNVVDGKSHSAGKLLAWDPVSQSERWSVHHKLAVNGAVLATAGNLVFQGNAMGEFNAYHAEDGAILWSIDTGTAISAAPVSYRLGDDQFVLISVGVGGILQFYYPKLHADENIRGPTRLLAFSLKGEASIPETVIAERKIRDLPAVTVGKATLEEGKALYVSNCRSCHGQDVVARYGGSIPDLRYTSEDTHAEWHAIVIGGSRIAKGMPPAELTVTESEAIQNFVLSEANKLISE